MMKLSFFDPSSGYKAYSYCGTVCKHYLIYKLTQSDKNSKYNDSYDDPDSYLGEQLNNDMKYSYNYFLKSSDNDENIEQELTKSTVTTFNRMVERSERKEGHTLTDNEVKVGKALVTLMNNWEDYFGEMGSDKFNKSSVLLYIKELTNLPPKDIKEAMKIYKDKYFENKEKFLDEW